MSVTPSDTSSQERVETKRQEKSEEKGGRMAEDGDFFCAMGGACRDGRADL